MCAVSIEEAQRRIRRQREASERMAGDRDDELVVEVAARFRALSENTVELDATRPVEELVRAVLQRIGQMAAGSTA